MTKFREGILFSSLLLFSACSNNKEEIPSVCTAIGVPAITVHFIDKETDQPISSCGFFVKISDGNFVEKLRRPFSPYCYNAYKLSGALGRAGTYKIFIASKKYKNWHKENIVVMPNKCNVNRVIVKAYLER